MNTLQIAVLSSLACAEYTKDETSKKDFQKFAMGIFTDKKYNLIMGNLIENGFITAEGGLTKKGKASIEMNPARLNPTNLSRRTNHYIFTSLQQGTFTEGLRHFNNDSLQELALQVINEVFLRNQQVEEFELSADLQEYLNPNYFEKAELSVVQPIELIEEKVEVKERAVKSKKVKAAVV